MYVAVSWYFPCMRSKRALLALVLAACGGAQANETPQNQPPPRSAVGDLNVRKLVLDMAEKKACAQLEGKWLGLPAQDDTSSQCPKNLTGADAGLACSWGRLQIRDCKSSVTNDALSLSFGGVGWTWVDQQIGQRRRAPVRLPDRDRRDEERVRRRLRSRARRSRRCGSRRPSRSRPA